MKLALDLLKPNPFRNFDVDPIDKENVKQLTASIKDDGFWGGVVVRKHDGEYQIACGHHRVQAAIKAGMSEADIYVLPKEHCDDQTMVRVYARENATQRGNTATAATGTVAAAIQAIAEGVFGEECKITHQARSEIESGKGIGFRSVMSYLGDIPNVTENTVRQQMASLKASGDYDNIIARVRKKLGIKAPEKVAEKEVTFDFKGVASQLKNDNQLRAFRDLVTGDGIAPYLPVDRQGQLAKEVVRLAEKRAKDKSGASGQAEDVLSSTFIREQVINLVLNAKHEERKAETDAEKKKREQAGLSMQAKEYQTLFCQQVRGMISAGVKLQSFAKSWPKNIPFPITAEMRSTLSNAKSVIDNLNKVI